MFSSAARTRRKRVPYCVSLVCTLTPSRRDVRRIFRTVISSGDARELFVCFCTQRSTVFLTSSCFCFCFCLAAYEQLVWTTHCGAITTHCGAVSKRLVSVNSIRPSCGPQRRERNHTLISGGNTPATLGVPII